MGRGVYANSERKEDKGRENSFFPGWIVVGGKLETESRRGSPPTIL